jgi:hypothetical protein
MNPNAVLLGLGGAVVGAIITAFVARSGSRNVATGAPLARPAGEWLREPESPSLELAVRSQAVASGPSSSPGAPSVPRTKRRPASPEEAQQREEEAHQRWASRYEHEAADPRWGPDAARSLSDELHGLESRMAFRATGVTCKTTMCAADLEWPDFARVAGETRTLVQHMYEQNCARTIYNPPPGDPGAPYRLTMYFDCETARIGSASVGSAP